MSGATDALIAMELGMKAMADILQKGDGLTTEDKLEFKRIARQVLESGDEAIRLGWSDPEKQKELMLIGMRLRQELEELPS